MKVSHTFSLLPTVFLLIGSSCNSSLQSNSTENQSSPGEAAPPLIGYSIVATHPHDTAYFTEGLEFYDGKLLESSGGNNQESPFPSAAGIADLKTGKIQSKILLDKNKYFGEGITVLNGVFYQLTWKSGIGFTYDIKTFKKTGEFRIPTQEGWGLTHDSSHLILSDGSNSIYFIDPANYQILYTLSVHDNNGPVGNLNELEWVNGVLYANRWQTNYILRIDTQTGKVTGKIDLSAIAENIASNHPYADVLNGIAYNAATGNLWVTGKKWPAYYEIKLQ
jgi:glutamine cyclotransferase